MNDKILYIVFTILFFGIFLGITSETNAQNSHWIKYYTSYWNDIDNTPSTYFYYDSESIKYAGNKIYFFEKQVPVNGITRNSYGKEISYTVIRFEVNCNSYTFKGISLTNYFVDGTLETDNDESQIYTASPDSKMYEFINKFCK